MQRTLSAQTHKGMSDFCRLQAFLRFLPPALAFQSGSVLRSRSQRSPTSVSSRESTMTIYEFSEKYKISLKKSRTLYRAGILLIDESENPIAEEMRYSLAHNQHLSTQHLLALIDNPKLAWPLGSYRKKAQALVTQLGDLSGAAAPREVSLNVLGASGGEPQAVAMLIEWLKQTVPAWSVGHHYVAVRLALGCDPISRLLITRRIPRALQICCRQPSFAGWWKNEKYGSRNRVRYCRPRMKFDL